MYSIRTKILAIVLTFAAVFGAAFVFYSIGTTVNYKRLRLEGINQTVGFETEKVNKIIAAIERGAVSLACEGLMFCESQSLEIGRLSALEYLRAFPIAHGSGFWFEPYAYNKNSHNVCVYAFYDRIEGNVRLDEFAMDDYDYHSLDWYREIIDNVKTPYQVIWTKPYIDDTVYRYLTTAGAGIFDLHNKLIGISIVDWGIEEVVKEIAAVKPTKNSFVVLCAPAQDYIISGTYIKNPIGASIKALPWDINAASFSLDDVKYLQFGRYMDNGWLLSVQIPENEIFSEIEDRNTRFSIITAAASVLILCIAYFLISALVNTPIKNLTRDVSRLVLGNLDVQVKVTSKDELGLLAGAFNKMKTDLKDSIEAYTLEHAEKERIDAELGIAAGIQVAMLPYTFPPFPERTDFDIFALMQPAKEVGGDLYDFFLIDENNVAVVIADVSGKGVPAALLMAITKTLIKNSALSGKSPGEVFDLVNNTLCENNNTSVFVTAFMGFYNTVSGRFVYINAGHCPPLIKKAGRDFELLKTKPCLVLACFEGVVYHEEEIFLEAGDTVFLYTDGVTEAMNPERELFSERRLIDTLKTLGDYPPLELLRAVKEELDFFAGGAGQADDITMLALKIDHLTHTRMMELIVEANIENIDDVIEFVNAALTRYGCMHTLKNHINLAVEEIFVNIAKYAYCPESGSVSVCIAAEGENVIIRFEDSGRVFNPLEHVPPDLLKLVHEQESAGLGIFIVTKIMDKVSYERSGGKNIFQMIKKIR